MRQLGKSLPSEYVLRDLYSKSLFCCIEKNGSGTLVVFHLLSTWCNFPVLFPETSFRAIVFKSIDSVYLSAKWG